MRTMVTEPLTPWPPVLGKPVTESLSVAFAGFDGAAARLAEVMSRTATVDSPSPDLVAGNVELSAALWFARTAVEQIGKREWPGGWDAFLGQLLPSEDTLLLAFGWARNHAGHALARVAAHHSGLLPGDDLYPSDDLYPQGARWVWAQRDDLPAGRRDTDGEGAYDRTLSGADLQPSIQAMANWLRKTDGGLVSRP